MSSSKKKKPATIVQRPTTENGWNYVVETDDGETYYLSGRGSPKGNEIGSKGFLQYQSSFSYGFWCWSNKDKDNV